jgi:hypothetical protein
MKFSSTTLLILLYTNCYAQFEADEIQSFNKFAHLRLSSNEWWSIVVGIILFLIAREIREKQKWISTGLFIIGFIALVPLIIVILAVAQKLLGYAFILGIILGVLYLLFVKKF